MTTRWRTELEGSVIKDPVDSDAKCDEVFRMTNRKRDPLVLAGLLNIRRVDANLLVVLLKRGKVLTSLGELTFLHTLTDVPVNKGTLRVQKVELVVKTAPSARDGSRVGKHTQAASNLGKVTTRDVSGRLITDTKLETGGAPVDELDRSLRLNDTDGSVDILRDDITTVQESAGHVLALPRVALHHLVTSLEAREGHVSDRVLFVMSLLSGDDGSEGGQGEVDTGEGDQVGLELVQVDVQ